MAAAATLETLLDNFFDDGWTPEEYSLAMRMCVSSPDEEAIALVWNRARNYLLDEDIIFNEMEIVYAVIQTLTRPGGVSASLVKDGAEIIALTLLIWVRVPRRESTRPAVVPWRKPCGIVDEASTFFPLAVRGSYTSP